MRISTLLLPWLGLGSSSSVPNCPSKCQCTDYGGKVRVDCHDKGLTEIPKRYV